VVNVVKTWRTSVVDYQMHTNSLVKLLDDCGKHDYSVCAQWMMLFTENMYKLSVIIFV